jgi:outer membrane protein
MINLKNSNGSSLKDNLLSLKKGMAGTVAMLVVLIIFASAQSGSAQRFAYVDSEYILSNIPSYNAAQDQLDKLAEGWQKEVEARYEEVEVLYRNYQNDRVLMSEDMRKRRENEIVTKEAEAAELQRKYFGPEGELFNSQQELITPIQDRVYKAVQEIATEGNYAVIFDTANSPTMLYTNPRNDVSDDVLKKLGYRN